MKSFRTELENSLVEKDIIDLERKISLFRKGKVDEERFRSLRLARGVYGQRQEGVQMVRIKLPYGKVNANQLRRIAAVSDEYSTGRLHITTRQDIQIHYVSLDRTPQLWAELEKDDITIREACGNTIRNITASPDAGVNPDEPFNVSAYAHEMFQYFLRNPICQEMGRKFKISFSSSHTDTGLSYMHDIGFIPKIKDGQKGFKVMLGGGLGSQPRHADLLYDFLPVNKIIPMTEGILRIFDRYGERSRRLKARMKFLINDLGLSNFVKLVEEEQNALPYKVYEIDEQAYDSKVVLGQGVRDFDLSKLPKIENKETYKTWKKTNVSKQKQKGFVMIGVKVLLGDFYSDKARKLADLIENYAGNELRFSLRQNFLIRHVKEELLTFFYVELEKMGLADTGYESLFDITACPGTDTCNLGIAGSTGISKELERVLRDEYPHYVNSKDLFIKISGCMNACGQHNMAPIGFQGMSIKKGKLVAPALQVLLGGQPQGDGSGCFSDKVIKIPSKRGPQALRVLLDDYEKNAEGISFSDYYTKKEKIYFYDLLKPLSDMTQLVDDDFIDWGYDKPYMQEVGIGECAGVVIDLVSTLFLESEEKLDNAFQSFEAQKYADSIYHSYASMINTAKALLLSEEVKTNTQASIISQFDEKFIENNQIDLGKSFSDLVYQIKHNEPSKQFAKSYYNTAIELFKKVSETRKAQLTDA